MKKKVVSKLMVNWVASFVSVILLLSMMAVPALAVLAANTVNSAAIINGQVRTPDLAGNAVTSAKIKNGQVKRSDIALGAVVSGRIADGAVTTAKIRNGHVRTADIAMGAVVAGRIADNAITSAKIRNGTITNADIAPGLNADKVDGKHASAFVENTGPQTIDGTVTAKGFSYDTTKTGYLSINPSALDPETLSNTYSRDFGSLYSTTASGTQKFHAPVQLPDGAKVTKVTFEIFDRSASYKLAWSLRVRWISGSSTYLDTMASTGTTNAFTANPWQKLTETSISYDVVDNSTYSYFIEAEFNGSTDSTIEAGRVLIEYTYTSPGS